MSLVLDLLEIVRRHQALFAAGVFIFFFASINALDRIERSRVFLRRHGMTLAALAGAAVSIGFFFVSVYYALSPEYYNHVEPQAVTLSWLFELGLPLYHGLDDAERYSSVYGPAFFAYHGVFLKLFGPSLELPKVVTTVTLAAAFAFMYRVLMKEAGHRSAFAGLGMASIMLASHRLMMYLVLPAAPLLLMVSVGLWAATSGVHWALAAMIVGALAGFSTGMKLYAGTHFLPLLVLVFHRYGMRAVMLACGAAVVVFIYPYIVYPNVSAANHLAWLKVTSVHKFYLGNFLNGLLFLFIITLPFILGLIIAGGGGIKGMRPFIAAFVAGCAAPLILGSKEGADAYYLVPFIPLALYAPASMMASNGESKRREGLCLSALWRSGLAAFLVAGTLVSLARLAPQLLEFRNRDRAFGQATVQEIMEILARYPTATIGMSYGGYYNTSFYRPLLVFAGNPYLIDAAALMDMQRGGLQVPQATLREIEVCTTRVWLGPRWSLPFYYYNYYEKMDLFGEEVRRTFLSRYRQVDEGKYFTVWVCRD